MIISGASYNGYLLLRIFHYTSDLRMARLMDHHVYLGFSLNSGECYLITPGYFVIQVTSLYYVRAARCKWKSIVTLFYYPGTAVAENILIHERKCARFQTQIMELSILAEIIPQKKIRRQICIPKFYYF